ncbi:MAG: alpha/beta hydrolase [Terricaulis sp.]
MPLDPLIAKLLDAAAKAPQAEPRSPEEARCLVKARIAAIPPTRAQIDSSQDLELDLDGRSIGARLYRPVANEMPKFVMFFHGGGWSVCDLDTHDNLCRRLCADANAAILSIDYRLAPEHPYPAAFDDCYAATAWALEHAARLSINAERFVLCGDSAGANLAAAVALALRDRDARQADGLALVYPGLRDPALGGESYNDFGEGFGFTRADALKSWRNYYPAQSEPIPVYAAPLHGERYDQLPPTLVITAEYDILRDEGELFAQRVRSARGSARAIRYPGMTHGFLALEPILGVAQAACRDLAVWTAARLGQA